MRSFAFLMSLIGIFAFITTQFSIWAAFGLAYSGALLLVVLVAFSAKRRKLATSGYTTLPADSDEIAADKTFSSKDLEMS
jgi:uncharacterized membrane protein